jgi:glutamate-1-semialdehyde 2,1-aminomutase
MEKKNYSTSAALLERAKNVMAGGVSSEFRKYSSPHALFYTHGAGSRLYDADGNEYLDFTLSQGPLILGHSHPAVVHAVSEYAANGQLYAGQHIKELELAEKIQQLIPSAELLRFCLDGSEAVQTAFRVARAKTNKKKFLRFEGHYHGWLDNVAWGLSLPAGSTLGERENPNVYTWTEGVAEGAGNEFIIIPWNDTELLKNTIADRHEEIAAIITEPIMCNNGCIMAQEGYLGTMRQLCTDYNMALIFDEVITGFRIGLHGAQGYFNITPDLTIFAKAIASGYPISVIAGKKEWMQLIADSKVIHAGTMNSGNATVAAALATIEVLEKENPYPQMFNLGQKLKAGLESSAAAHGLPLFVQGPGPMINTSFTKLTEVKDFRDCLQSDKAMLSKFIAAMHEKGIRIIGRGLWYISAVHTQADIDHALSMADEVFAEMASAR